jgi:hypothetical protein
MVEHTMMVPNMMPFLLFLWIVVAAVTVGLIVLPRVVVRTILKVAGLFFVGLLIAIIFRGLVHGGMDGPSWVFFFLLLCGLTFLLVWGLSRLLSSSPPGDGRVDAQPLRIVRDFIAERMPPRERRDRRVKVWPLLLAVFLMGFAFLLLSESAFKPGHPFTTVFFFLMFFVGLLVFFWATLHILVLPVVHAPRPDCPPIGRLKDFLSERLRGDERARVAEHLDRCTVCQHRVEGLTAGQGAWSVVARKLTQASPPPEPVLKRVMDNLKGMPDEHKSREEPSLTADLPLGFLSPSDKPDQLGRLDRYDVMSEIGRGGMGVVLKAFDPSLHRVVAIKVLAPQLATSGVARNRFQREAKAAAAVTHDHIVTIHAVEESNGLPYLVMQYIAGQSLQERLDKEGPINDLAEVLRIGMQTASALAAAHSHGIVHRDIKPGNILLEEGVQRVKITDFGLARAMDDASLTQSGYVAGSPLYMAPEQARGEALDHRADLFSLGSVLYTVCTGRPPFRAANTLAVLRRVCEDIPRPIREINPAIPDWLVAVIEKLMAKEPVDRFQSAGEVVDALGQHLAQLQQAAWVPTPQPAPAPAGATSVAGLPTSLTICPSCGASLHVPERMVGALVHCGECGKPFRVEDTSEVMQVARPVPPPFNKRAGAKRKMPIGYLFLILCAIGVCLLTCFAYLLMESGPGPAPPTMSAPRIMEGPPAAMAPTGMVGDPFWRNELKWFPAEATLFAAIDLSPFGSLRLDDDWTQTLLGLALTREATSKLTSNNLGRVRIDRVGMAYYERQPRQGARGLVQLTGQIEDNRIRLVDTIRDATANAVRVREDAQGRLTFQPAFRLSAPELPFAVGMFDEHRVFLARAMNSGKEADHRKALELLPWFATQGPLFRSELGYNLLNGQHLPWIRTVLGQIPPDTCAFCLGEIPAEWRNWLSESLKLRATPRRVYVSLKHENAGNVVSVRLNVDKAGAELLLKDDLEKWRRQGLDELQTRFHVLKKEAEAIALLTQVLDGNLRFAANSQSGEVTASVRFSGPAWKALGTLAKRMARPGEARP